MDEYILMVDSSGAIFVLVDDGDGYVPWYLGTGLIDIAGKLAEFKTCDWATPVRPR